MIVNDEDGHFSHIKCDVETCDARSPEPPHAGLIALGWYASGGKHRCPKHKEQDDG